MSIIMKDGVSLSLQYISRLIWEQGREKVDQPNKHLFRT